MAANWDYAQLSCDGGREVNEDSVVCVPAAIGVLVVVADGLGGHGRGEMASRLLTDVFEREFKAQQEPLPDEFLALAFETAQKEILKLQEEYRAPDEMKTTAVALAITGNSAYWAHCGDTRLYHFSRGKLKERTLDHSVPQMLVLSGEIKEKHIAGHPDRNKLLRVVGIPWDSPRYQIGGPAVIAAETAFLLCTDGFWEHINPKMITKYLKKTKSAEEWLALMKTEVEKNAKGTAMDNYTAAAIRTVEG